MKIALFSGMFRDFSLEMTIQQAAQIGYDGVEVMVGFSGHHLDADCSAERARKMAQIAEDNNIDYASYTLAWAAACFKVKSSANNRWNSSPGFSTSVIGWAARC